MTKTRLDESSLLNLIEMTNSSANKLRKQLENSSEAQVARILGRHDVNHLLTSVQQASIAFEAYAKSSQWAEFSTSIKAARRVLGESESVAGLQVIDQNLRNLALSADRAFLPAANALTDLSASATRAIQTVQNHFAEVEHWHSSIAQRMASLVVPWAMEDHFGVSAVGFTRIARLHDLSIGAESFSPRTSEVFEEELGQPVPFDSDGKLEDREATAIDAGLNPEVVAFPVSVYPTVLFSAGFEFSVEVIGDVRSDKGDSSGVFDPQHTSLLGQVENRLRMTVESALRKLVGEGWYRSRVPGPTLQRWRERKEEDHRQRGDSYRLIFYADFTDLSEIICRRDNWDDTFHRLFVSKPDLQVSLQRLSPIRKAIAHNRPLVRTDQIVLFSEAYRLLSALGLKL